MVSYNTKIKRENAHYKINKSYNGQLKYNWNNKFASFFAL